MIVFYILKNEGYFISFNLFIFRVFAIDKKLLISGTLVRELSLF
jgi:hypothetical protein